MAEAGILLSLLSEYGWAALAFVIVLIKLDTIMANLQKFLDRIAPKWAEKRRWQREKEEQSRTAKEKERIDTIMALKDMLLAYRNELDDAKAERRRLQTQMYEMVQTYERHDTQIVTALQSINMLLQAQCTRLDTISQNLEA